MSPPALTLILTREQSGYVYHLLNEALRYARDEREEALNNSVRSVVYEAVRECMQAYVAGLTAEQEAARQYVLPFEL